MVAIPFPLSTSPGTHEQESAGRLINVMAEPLGEGARAKAKFIRAPGLSSFATSSEETYRGGILVGGTFFAAWDGEVRRYTSAGGAGNAVGDMPGDAHVFWARNNKTTPDIVAVAPGEGAFSVTAGSVVSFADGDLPIPNSVCFLQGFFIFTIGDGRVFASGLNDITVDPLDFATAESKPDTLYRAVPIGTGQLLLCGSNSMEVWGPPINASGFPFSYITTIPRGLIAANAIAGHEDGFGKGIIFVGDDNGVHVLNGYQPDKISPPDLDRLIEAVEDKTTLEAGVFVWQGHACFALSSPEWTWVFDLNTLKWHERESYGLTRWRATQPQYAFGKWLVGDTQSGNILAIDPAAKTEVGTILRARCESGPAHAFPARTACMRADFDITTGVGQAAGEEPTQTDPQVGISWSDDGGVTWGVPLLRPLGRQAVAKYPVSITRTGLTTSKGRRWRLDVSDAVYFSLMGGDMSTQMRRP